MNQTTNLDTTLEYTAGVHLFPRRAVIFGVTGQDGSFLAEQLLDKGYIVAGVTRRRSTNGNQNLTGILSHPQFHLVEGDVTDSSSVHSVIADYDPHEVYNLAAQSHVGTSFNQPHYTFNATAIGCLNVLEAIRVVCPDARFYQAGSSEMFGTSVGANNLQDESTPMLPCSPYAAAKLAAHNLVSVYRRSYELFACSGILFNHESERRGENFVTRKITKYFARTFRNGRPTNFQKLKLGNLSACRDWGYAPEYTDAMWRMLQHEEPQDFVIATGHTSSVYDFLVEVAALNGVSARDVGLFIEHDGNCNRPCEVPYLAGDYSKAKELLGWEPKTLVRGLAKKMVAHDGEEAAKENRP